MKRLLIVSYDAVGDTQVERLLEYPHFGALARRAALVRGVDTVFLSNTYPVHCSVATGVQPCVHRLVNNTEPFPKPHPRWNTRAAAIQARTLWQAAAQQGMRTAAVMWPVTGGAREIRYNIPELMIQPGQNQIVENLKAGSKLLQMRLFWRHGRVLRGIAQPWRDRFATLCMADILREKRPQLALMHLTAYDDICHHHGPGAPQLDVAFESLDENLGTLLAAAGEDCHVIIFSDHAQLPSGTTVLPNEVLVRLGHLQRDAEGNYVEGPCFIECCGGSAFLHPGALDNRQLGYVMREIEALEGFARFLTQEELRLCGREGLPCGFAARPGYCWMADEEKELGNHGYPADWPDYKVFYLVCSAGSPPVGPAPVGGSLLDVTVAAAALLGLDMPGMQGQRREGLLPG